MRRFLRFHLLAVAYAFAAVSLFASPTDVDPSFQFANHDVVDVRDIKLFPDGTIAYGGTAFDRLPTPDRIMGILGKISSNGAPLTVPDPRLMGTTESIALDPARGFVFGVGARSMYGIGLIVRDGFSQSYAGFPARGVGRQVLSLPDGDILIAGDIELFELSGATNHFGLLRLDQALVANPTFNFTNSIGLNMTAAALLTNGQILASHQFTNDSGTVFGLSRWETNGLRDLSYSDPLPDGSKVTLIEKAPGTNGFFLAVEKIPEATGSIPRTSILRLDEAGLPVTETNAIDGLEIEGTVNAITFAALRPETAARADYDQVIIGGNFRKVGDTPCNNLAAVSKEGTVVWHFSTDQGPSGPINALAIQLDGKLLIAGAFTNVSGFTNSGLARLEGNSSITSYLFWADSKTVAFEKSGNAELALVRHGNTNQSLSVSISTLGHPGETNLPAIPSRLDFAPGQSVLNIPVTVTNDALRQNRRSFSATVSVADTNVLVSRAETDLVILDDETDGTLVPDFNPAPTLNAKNIETFAVQDDGRIIVAINTGDGSGLLTNGPPLLRLNTDGSLDQTFVTNTIRALSTAVQEVRYILPDPNGKIYVAGQFAAREGTVPFYNLVRLHSDGTLDTNFNSRLFGSQGKFEHAGVAADLFENGDLAIWTSLNSSYLGMSGILRFDSNGNFLRFYTNSTPWRLLGVSLEASKADALFAYDPLKSNPVHIKKYDGSGQVDTNFTLTFSPSGYVAGIRTSGDSLLVGGSFSVANNIAVSNIVRVDIDTGAVDTNFNPQVNGAVRAFHERSGRIYISGSFTEVNGRARPGLARLNSDGSLDETFDPGLGANYPIEHIRQAPDGDLIVGTNFDRFDGVTMTPLARLEVHNLVDSPLSLQLALEGEEAVISYSRGTLQTSTNLTSWDEIHSGGGQFRTNLPHSHQFFRATSGVADN